MNGIILEKDKLTSGTTWHSAGLHWNCRPNFNDIESGINTLKMINEIEVKTKTSCGFKNNGGLYLANNQERLNEYLRMKTLCDYYNLESYILDKNEIQGIHPFLNVDDIVGGLYSPNDGSIDPDGLTKTLLKASKLNGCVLHL